MAIILSHPMTPQEIRVLQEFRRLAADTLALEALKSVRHPAGGGEEPPLSLTRKGYLRSDPAAGTFSLTQKGKDFIALDVKPEFD